MINRSGIYKITCTANGRFYIGSAVNFRERWNTHRSATRRGKHHSRHLQNTWNKYGQDAFKFEVLLLCAKEDLIMYEQLAIKSLNPVFNTQPAAGTPLGYKHTSEARQNMSAAQKLVDRKGRSWHKPTESAKKKLSETITKQKQWADPAYRAKMVNAVKGRKRTSEEIVASATANGVQVTIGETVYRSTKEAARVVGRHVSTLMTWVRKGVVPASFFGVTVTTVSQWVDAAVVRKPRKMSFHSRYTGLPVKAIP